MLDYHGLEGEVPALDASIERQVQLIGELKERLRHNEMGMVRETHLLGELTREIIRLRELRDRRYEMEAMVRASVSPSSRVVDYRKRAG